MSLYPIADAVLRERLRPKIDRRGPDDCWNWTASRDDDGYGFLRVGPKGGYRFKVAAHRATYHLEVAAITATVQVLHKCDNPACCNPAHLFPGTPRINSDDKVAKGRQSRLRGDGNGAAKLSADDAADVRSRYQFRVVTMEMLAAEKGVSLSAIKRVLSGKSF